MRHCTDRNPSGAGPETHPSQFGGVRRDGGEGRLVWLGDIHCEGEGEEIVRREKKKRQDEPGVYALHADPLLNTVVLENRSKVSPGAGPISGEFASQPRCDM